MSKPTPKKKISPKKKETGKKSTPAKNHMDESMSDGVSPAAPVEKSVVDKITDTPVEKKPITRAELISRRFDSQYVAQPVTVAATKPDIPEAPPFISSTTDEEYQRIKAVLFRQFDFKEAAAAFEKAEIERLAAEKAEAERLEAERIAAEKAEAERIAAEKARIEAERLEAERIAAEKAEAERIAAEKARIEAERLEAERIAAEKAEAERIAAEKARIEAERIAAEKAEAARLEAERIAAEKARIEKAKAELEAMKLAQSREKTSSVTYEKPKTKKGDDAMDKSIKMMAGGVLALFLLLCVSSFSNTGKYYIKTTSSGIDIWQGRFSPMGEKLMLSLPGLQAPETHGATYSKKEIYPIIFEYYLEKTDALIKTADYSTIEAIRAQMNQARPYAITQSHKQAVDIRLNGLDQMLELYKADVFASYGTLEGYQAARDILVQARTMTQYGQQTETIDKRLAAIEAAMDQLTAVESPEQPANPK
ncbi:MAG: hypothetical protein AB7S77_13650 [Desulfatirhabdiaceae bacterium]